MRCAINTLPFERGGGITYLKNVLPKLSETDDQYFIFVSKSQNRVEKIQSNNIEYVEISFPTGNILLRLIYEQLIFPIVLSMYDIDVLYSPTGITTLISPCATVNAVRNPNPFVRQPERPWKERLKNRIRRFLIRQSVRTSNETIYISKYTKEIVSNHFHVGDKKSHIVYHGINKNQFENIPQSGNEELDETISTLEPYLLCVSTIYKHKNYETLINGFAELPDNLRKKYPLVIVGGHPDQEYYKSIVQLAKSHGVEESVVFLGRVDYENVPFLYKYAEISVLPSKLETFGHSLVESMAAGTPVVAADSASIPEITANAAQLFDPNDHIDLANCLHNVLTDETLKQELISSGSTRVKDFSWDQTVGDTYHVLCRAADKESS